MFTGKTYADQSNTIDALTYYGSSDWVMASADMASDLYDQLELLNKSFSDVFSTSFYNYNNETNFYYGRYNQQYQNSTFHYFMGSAERRLTGKIKANYPDNTAVWSDSDPASFVGAWAATSANATVPEPDTLLLLTPCFLGLIALRRKLSRQ